MSGGHYDYRYMRVRELSAEIAQDANGEADEAVRNAMDYCASQLEALSGLARAIEWYMSGDYGPESVIAEFKKVSA
jgi:pilus assembly protein TadC